VTVEHTACAGCLRTAVIAGLECKAVIVGKAVIAGLDPAIHRLAKKDGCAGQARA